MTKTKHDYVNSLLDNVEQLIKKDTFPDQDDVGDLHLTLDRLQSCIYEIDASNYYWLRHIAYRTVHGHFGQSSDEVEIALWKKFQTLLGYIESNLRSETAT